MYSKVEKEDQTVVKKKFTASQFKQTIQHSYLVFETLHTDLNVYYVTMQFVLFKYYINNDSSTLVIWLTWQWLSCVLTTMTDHG